MPVCQKEVGANMYSTYYAALSQTMMYYHMEFYVYFVTFIIMALQTIKAVVQTSKKNELGKTYYLDLIIGGFIITSNIGGMIFQGALLDISQGAFSMWLTRLFIIAILNFVLFIVQLILWNRKK